MKRILFLIALTVLGLTAQGQLDPDCPGFRNTTSFSTGSSFYYWTARVGDRISSGASTGYTVYSTCAASSATRASIILTDFLVISSVFYDLSY